MKLLVQAGGALGKKFEIDGASGLAILDSFGQPLLVASDYGAQGVVVSNAADSDFQERAAALGVSPARSVVKLVGGKP